MFTFTELAIFLVAYLAFFISLSYAYTKGYDTSKSKFLIVDRRAGFLESSLSVGGAWVWGIALFVSAAVGFDKGWAGLSWFLIPNMAALGIWAWWTKIVNNKMPNGYTLSSYMREHYDSNRVAALYQALALMLALAGVVVNLTAITKLLTVLGVSYIPILTAILGLGVFIYSSKGGLKANLLTGSVQMATLLLALFGILVVSLSAGGGEYLVKAINGKKNIDSLFDWNLLSTFGIATALTLLPGCVGNQIYYQRSLSQQEQNFSNKTFAVGAVLFGLVPFIMGILGIMANGYGIEVKDLQTAHIEFIKQTIGIVGVGVFGVVILNAVANAMDCSFTGSASVIAHDFNKNDNASVLIARVTMFVVLVLGWFISTYNIDLWIILLAYGSIRACTFIINLLTLTKNPFSERGVFYAILFGAIITSLINWYAGNVKMPVYAMYAAVFAMFAPTVIAYIITKFLPKRV